ncbi:MAG: hypothetical protein ABMA02_11255 [Saprospiraceae bacterium]
MIVVVFQFLFALWQNALAQQPDGKIHLQNPSFEDRPQASHCPSGWVSFTLGSTPDIMPGAWGVHVRPQDGLSCMALVVREDGTREDVSQRLPQSLQPGVCYTIVMHLTHSKEYVGYNLPARLRIWGGSEREKRQMLATSGLIDHEDWKEYKFQFVPNHEMRYITFEAFYAPGSLRKYRGNILLDNCSPIERCDRA